MPVVPRTNASEISAAAIEQALAAGANREPPSTEAAAAASSPEIAATADVVTSEPPRRPTVNPITRPASDLISLARTTSDEWMASDANDGAYEVGPRRPRWAIPAVVGGIAALGVGLLLAFGGSKDRASRTSVVANEGRVGSASEQVAVAVVPVDAAEVITVAMDAAAVAQIQVDAQIAVTPIDAQVAVTPTDAAPVADAAVRVAEVRADAAVPAEVATKPTTTPDTTVATKPLAKPKEPKPPAAPQDERTIEQLVDATEFAKANKACATNTIFSTPRLVACAIAACNTHSDVLAARWIRAIPRASRDEIVAKCKSLGVEVAAP